MKQPAITLLPYKKPSEKVVFALTTRLLNGNAKLNKLSCRVKKPYERSISRESTSESETSLSSASSLHSGTPLENSIDLPTEEEVMKKLFSLKLEKKLFFSKLTQISTGKKSRSRLSYVI